MFCLSHLIVYVTVCILSTRCRYLTLSRTCNCQLKNSCSRTHTRPPRLKGAEVGHTVRSLCGSVSRFSRPALVNCRQRSRMADLLSYNNSVMAAFAFYAVVVLAKMMLMALWTSIVRSKKGVSTFCLRRFPSRHNTVNIPKLKKP